MTTQQQPQQYTFTMRIAGVPLKVTHDGEKMVKVEDKSGADVTEKYGPNWGCYHLTEQNVAADMRKRTALARLAQELAAMPEPAPKPKAAPAPKPTPAPATPAAPRTGGTTNADKVRAMIREDKDKGQPHVVQRAVKELGMKESMAKTYVKNNWEKA